MFCGTGNFSHVDDEDCCVLPTTPKSKKRSKNPYSARGLDKFSTVLAELEARREKIMAYEGAALVRFMYNNSQDWVPIIVKPKEPAKQEVKQLAPMPAPASTTEIKEEAEKVDKVAKKEDGKVKKSLSFSWNRRGFIYDHYYWPLVIFLILVCLVMFGRVFAICCTSIWWYMVPTIAEWNEKKDLKKSMNRRRELGRRMSDKRLGGNVIKKMG